MPPSRNLVAWRQRDCLRKEALTTPFICLERNEQAIRAWQIRILRQGYCLLRTEAEETPTKCGYCLIHVPYRCMYKTTAQQLLFRKLFE